MNDKSFLVAGGGIAGLAAALGLSRAGRTARLFERAAEFQEVGAGLQLGPNATTALRWLGAWEAVEPLSFAPREIHVCDGVNGRLLQRVRLGQAFEQRFGMPYRTILRSDLLKAMLETARDSSFITLQTGTHVTVKSLRDAILQIPAGEISGRGLIAADGVHSAIRIALQSEDCKHRQSHTLYRKLLPLAQWPQGIEADVVTLWLCPGGHIVHYLVAGGTSLNIVACVEEQESGAQPRFGPLHDRAEAVLQSEGEWLAWQGYDLPPDPRWSLGKTVLVGDAAHAMLPYLAQGAGMALEDACVLGLELNRQPDNGMAFAAYTARRFKRVARMQRASRAQGRLYHMAGVMRQARNSALRLMPESLFLKRMEWVYRWRP